MHFTQLAVAALVQLMLAGIAGGDLAQDYERLLKSDGPEYAKRRAAFLAEDRQSLKAMLRQRRDDPRDMAEKRLVEALLARLSVPEEVALLETSFREKSRHCAGICLRGWHVIPRPDPEITGDGMWLLFADEPVEGTGHADYGPRDFVEQAQAQVRLPKSTLWVPVLTEIVMKGWTATEEPTPEPIPFERLPMRYVGVKPPRFAGPRAPNGDLYVFYAIELLSRRGEQAVVGAVAEYARSHTGYPERQRRATIALRRLGGREGVHTLLALALEENLFRGTRVEAFHALAELGDRSVVSSLRRLVDDRDPEDAKVPSPWALHASRTIRAIEERVAAK